MVNNVWRIGVNFGVATESCCSRGAQQSTCASAGLARTRQPTIATTRTKRWRTRGQNFTLNTPLVTTLLPVAFVPASGTSVSENVPEAEFAVLDVTTIVPVPPLVAVALHSEF